MGQAQTRIHQQLEMDLQVVLAEGVVMVAMAVLAYLEKVMTAAIPYLRLLITDMAAAAVKAV